MRKATVSFVTSVSPSVRIDQLGSHCTDFHEIWKQWKSFQWEPICSMRTDGQTWRSFPQFNQIALRKKFTRCPLCVFVCFVWVLEKTAFAFLHNWNCSVFKRDSFLLRIANWIFKYKLRYTWFYIEFTLVAPQPISDLGFLVVKFLYPPVGATLNEWSALRTDLYLHNTQLTQYTNIHALSGIQTSDPHQSNSRKTTP